MCYYSSYTTHIEIEAGAAECDRHTPAGDPLHLPTAFTLVVAILVVGCALIATAQWLF